MGLEVETLEKMLKVYSPLGTCTTDFLLVVLVQIPKGIFFLRQFMLHLLLSDLQDFQQLLSLFNCSLLKAFSLSLNSALRALSLLVSSYLYSSSCCWRVVVNPGKLEIFRKNGKMEKK